MIITFLIGVTAGGYLYLIGFAPQIEKASEYFESDPREVDAGFLLSGERYGGCERADACASFQVRADGTFSYLSTGVLSGGTPITGELPRAVLLSLREAATKENLRAAAKEQGSDTCSSFVDGTDYRYEITLNTVVYDLDTCYTAFSHQSEIGLALDKLWIYFQNL